MNVFQYYVIQYHHGYVENEHVNVGVVVVDPEGPNIFRVVDSGSHQERRLEDVGRGVVTREFITEWASRLVDDSFEDIERLRKKSYMSSILLSEPRPCMALTPSESMDRLFPLFVCPKAGNDKRR